jgi:hypothetical protein
MFELTKQQRQHLSDPEPLALDPDTGETYVLVRKQLFDRLQLILSDDTVYTSAEMLDRVMADDDANDPYLDELQKRYGVGP